MNQKAFSHSMNRLFSVFLLVSLFISNSGGNSVSLVQALEIKKDSPASVIESATNSEFIIKTGNYQLPESLLTALKIKLWEISGRSGGATSFGVGYYEEHPYWVWINLLVADGSYFDAEEIGPSFLYFAVKTGNTWRVTLAENNLEYLSLLDSVSRGELSSEENELINQYYGLNQTGSNIITLAGGLLFPWSSSQNPWRFSSNGFHPAGFELLGVERGAEAIDIIPPTSAQPAKALAMEDGSVSRILECTWNTVLILTHDGYPSTKKFVYLHLQKGTSNVGMGARVSRGQYLGELRTPVFNGYWSGSTCLSQGSGSFNCERDINPATQQLCSSSTTRHLHLGFGIDRNIVIDGNVLANLSPGSSYNSTNGGSPCPGPSLKDPPVDYISRSQNINFSWSPPNCTFRGYTFRVNDSPNLDDTPIIDEGEGGTSRTELIGTEWNNRDLWWGVRAANAPSGASWSESRRFRIEPVPPHQWHAKYFSDQNWSSQRCERDFNGSGIVGADFSEDWGDGAPTTNCSGMPSDNFSVRYTGTFSVPSTGIYWFHVKHDDSAILWIDNTEFRWPSSGEDCPAQTLSSGNHTFRIDYRENTGSAHIRLDVWNHDCDQKPRPFNKSSPGEDATNQPTHLALNWETSIDATSYEYCYDTSDDNACSSWVSTGTTPSANLSGLSLNTTYYWQVRAKNAFGTTYANGSDTAYWSFLTGGGPPPGAFGKTVPANGSIDQATNPTLSWGTSSGASSYEYCISTTNDACSSWVPTGTNTSVTLSGLSPDTIYYWQVRAINENGTTYADGSSTAYWSFRTAIVVCTTLPGAFSKTSPANGSTGQATNLTFSWGMSSGASSYEYCYDTTNDNACSSPWVSNGTTTSASPSGLSPNTIYYWQVVAVNDCGQTYADGNTWWSFSTASTSGPRVSTTVNVPSIAPGGTALVSVSLLDVPANTYASAEFICNFDVTVVEARDIAFSNLFGADAVPIVTTPQNGSFIAAIAGSNGNRATTGGQVLTFNLKGLQVGQTTIECTARVSKGDNFAIPLPSSGSLLKVQSRPDPMGILRGQVFASKPVTVKFRKLENTSDTSMPTQMNGTFILPISPGNYRVIASASGFLSVQVDSVTITDGNTTTLPTFHLLAGDIDGNNVINQLDAMTIGMNYGTSTPAEADLNNDSVIDFLDLELLARNYLKTGPVAWQENNTNAETLIDPEVE